MTPLIDRYEAALEAIVRLAVDDRQAYAFDPAFHAAVTIARQALAVPAEVAE